MLRVLLALLFLTASVWAEQDIGGLTLPFKEKLELKAPGLYKAFSFGPLDEQTPEAMYQFQMVDSTAPPEEKLANLASQIGRSGFGGLNLNLRKTEAKIGPWKVLVIDGTGLDKVNTFLCTVVIATADKLFMFEQFSLSPYVHQSLFAKLSGFKLGGVGLTGAPTDFAGEYRLEGFRLQSPSYFHVRAVGHDQDYSNSYDAELGETQQLMNCFYFLRELKPDDLRSDAEIFYSLAQKSNLLSELTQEDFARPEELVNEESSDWHTRCQFKRQGRKVAVLVRRCSPEALPTVEAVILD